MYVTGCPSDTDTVPFTSSTFYVDSDLSTNSDSVLGTVLRHITVFGSVSGTDTDPSHDIGSDFSSNNDSNSVYNPGYGSVYYSGYDPGLDCLPFSGRNPTLGHYSYFFYIRGPRPDLFSDHIPGPRPDFFSGEKFKYSGMDSRSFSGSGVCLGVNDILFSIIVPVPGPYNRIKVNFLPSLGTEVFL